MAAPLPAPVDPVATTTGPLRWAGVAVGVLIGVAAVLLGSAFVFVEVSVDEGETDCGRNPRELLIDDLPARPASLTTACRAAAQEEAIAGTVVTAAGIALAVWSVRRPRDLAGADLELALMDRRGRWRAPRTTRSVAEIAAVAWGLVGVVALAWLPIEAMAVTVGLGASVIALTAWLLHGPQLRRTPAGLVVRSWLHLGDTVPWRDIELVLPTTRGLLLVTSDEERTTNLFGGLSRTRRRTTDRAAHDVARSVVAAQGRHLEDAAVVTDLVRPPSVPRDDDPVWDELDADQRRALRRDVVEAALMLGAIVVASVVARALGW